MLCTVLYLYCSVPVQGYKARTGTVQVPVPVLPWIRLACSTVHVRYQQAGCVFVLIFHFAIMTDINLLLHAWIWPVAAVIPKSLQLLRRYRHAWYSLLSSANIYFMILFHWTFTDTTALSKCLLFLNCLYVPCLFVLFYFSLCHFLFTVLPLLLYSI